MNFFVCELRVRLISSLISFGIVWFQRVVGPFDAWDGRRRPLSTGIADWSKWQQLARPTKQKMNENVRKENETAAQTMNEQHFGKIQCVYTFGLCRIIDWTEKEMKEEKKNVICKAMPSLVIVVLPARSHSLAHLSSSYAPSMGSHAEITLIGNKCPTFRIFIFNKSFVYFYHLTFWFVLIWFQI